MCVGGLKFVKHFNTAFGKNEGVIVEHCIRVDVRRSHKSCIGHVSHRQIYVIILFAQNEEYLFAVDFDVFSKFYVFFSFGFVESDVFYHDDFAGSCLEAEGGTTCEILELLVELEAVIAGLGTEYTATADEYRRVDVADTAAAAAFLLVEL